MGNEYIMNDKGVYNLRNKIVENVCTEYKKEINLILIKYINSYNTIDKNIDQFFDYYVKFHRDIIIKCSDVIRDDIRFAKSEWCEILTDLNIQDIFIKIDKIILEELFKNKLKELTSN